MTAPLILASNTISGEYEVANSLRFENTSTDGLTRTISSSGNRRTWTWSGWVKRSKLTATTGDPQILFNSGQNTSGILDFNVFRFNTDDTFLIAGVSNNGATTNYSITTNAVYRDVSAWYHVVVAFDSTQATESNRIKLYIQGEQVTSFSSTTYPSLNYDSFVNFVTRPYYGIGDRINSSGQLFAGYMSEICLIDGQQLDPTSFGEFDEDTGIWKPIDVSGLTFGTNGFYLDFENSGSLGADVSGNGNNFTVNNLTSIDQTTDTCTNNFATLNVLNKVPSDTTFSNGNTSIAQLGGDGSNINSTLGVSSGKYYWEAKVLNWSSDARHAIGIGTGSNGYNSQFWKEADGIALAGHLNPVIILQNNSIIATLTGVSITTNDILSFALDKDNNKFYIGKNGTWLNSGDPTSGATGTGALGTVNSTETYFASTTSNNADGNDIHTNDWYFNFGNPAFTISSGNSDGNGYGNFEYSVPSGYYALNTKNLAEYG